MDEVRSYLTDNNTTTSFVLPILKTFFIKNFLRHIVFGKKKLNINHQNRCFLATIGGFSHCIGSPTTKWGEMPWRIFAKWFTIYFLKCLTKFYNEINIKKITKNVFLKTFYNEMDFVWKNLKFVLKLPTYFVE